MKRIILMLALFVANAPAANADRPNNVVSMKKGDIALSTIGSETKCVPVEPGKGTKECEGDFARQTVRVSGLVIKTGAREQTIYFASDADRDWVNQKLSRMLSGIRADEEVQLDWQAVESLPELIKAHKRDSLPVAKALGQSFKLVATAPEAGEPAKESH